MDAGEVDKMEIKAGLSSGGYHQERDKSQRYRAIPKKAADHQYEKKVETMEELLVVGVLHLSHSAKLFGPQRNQKAAFQDQSTLGQLLFLSQQGADLIGLFRLAYLQ
jgi:hypothetical protein